MTPRRRPWLPVVVGVGGFALLAALVLPGLTHPLDVWVAGHVQRPLGHWQGDPPAATNTSGYVRTLWVPDPPLLGHASGLGHKFTVQGATAVLALAMVAAGRWRSAVIVAAGGILNAVATSVLQDFFGPLTEHLRAAEPYPVPVLFPSGHTMGATFTWSLVALMLARHLAPPTRPWRRAAVATAVVLSGAAGLDRMLGGQHVLADVGAGWLLGTALVGACLWIDAAWRTPEPVPGVPSADEEIPT